MEGLVHLSLGETSGSVDGGYLALAMHPDIENAPIYIEIDDQGWSHYGGILGIAVNSEGLRIRFDEVAGRALGERGWTAGKHAR